MMYATSCEHFIVTTQRYTICPCCGKEIEYECDK